MPERRVSRPLYEVSRPLEAERERELIQWALAEGYVVQVAEGSPYVVLIDKIPSSVPAFPPAPAGPYDQDGDA